MRKIVIDRRWVRFFIALITGAIIIIFVSGCTLFKKSSTSNYEEPSQEELQLKNFEPWYQDNDPNLKVGDPVVFFNQFRIKVRGRIPKVEKMLEDGSYVTNDKSININLPVEALTPGEVAYIESGANGPVLITVAFKKSGFKKEQILEKQKRELNEIEEFDVEKEEASVSSQSEKIEDNPLNYYRVFKVLPDKTFTLDARVEIFIEGKSYGAKARIDGNQSGYCLLLVDKKHKNNQKNVGGPAPGVDPVKGKKVIE